MGQLEPALPDGAVRAAEDGGVKTVRIRLGGDDKRKKWFWLSGKPCELKLKMDWNYQIPSRNLNHISLRNGEFYDSWNGQLFLCEWPNSKPHPRIAGTRR